MLEVAADRFLTAAEFREAARRVGVDAGSVSTPTRTLA